MSITDSSLQIHKVDLATLSDDASKEYLAYSNRIRAESNPDDPPRTLEGFLARRRNVPSFMELHNWVVRDSAQPENPIVAWAELHIAHQGSNQHFASFGIDVLPERRREGIARRLLLPVATIAKEKGRTLLMSGSNDRIPAGEQFLTTLGAERGLASHTNQLVLADLDRAALQAYQEESLRRGSADFELIRCGTPFPEELVEATCELANTVANDIPLGDLGIEPEHFTPDQIREMDKNAIASGMVNIVLIARAADGKLAGITMTTWSTHAPYMVQQGITGVLPEFRGRGLARWLKATMLEVLLEEYPQVRFVRTDNADSNAGMLAINRALGFRPYRSETLWQIPTDHIFTYLERPSSAA